MLTSFEDGAGFSSRTGAYPGSGSEGRVPVHGPKGRAGEGGGGGIYPPSRWGGGPVGLPGAFLKNWIKLVHCGHCLHAIVTSLKLKLMK